MILYATKLRAYAIVAVVLIHLSARLVTQEVGTVNWWIGNMIDSSSRWSVPVFLMLSGMLLLDKKETQLQVVKKRVTKIVWPLLFWTLIFTIWQTRFDFTLPITDAVYNLLQNDAKYHLWYLYVILGLYLALPLFKTFIKFGNRADIWYFVALSFFISACYTTFSSIYGIRLASGLEYFLGYGGYFLLGYLLANTTLTRKTEVLLVSSGLMGLAGTIFGTWYVSLRDGGLNQVFYEYLSFTTPLVAAAIFILIKRYGNNKSSGLTTMLAKYSFGIYLIHPIFLDFFRGREFVAFSGISMETVPTLLYLLFILVISLICSVLLSMIMSRMPYIRRLV